MQDILWKGAIEDFFEEMLDYFFSDWADFKYIDFQKGFEFLDQELHSIYPERSKKRIADKLVKVYLKDGRERWFLVHIEVQGYRDEEFP
ncbi:MAG: hypothetical protein RMJ89_06830, partial [Flammeovirgaceae bacterium]|nr:hypothetical protein [Flammeovirgaceae bacterium]